MQKESHLISLLSKQEDIDLEKDSAPFQFSQASYGSTNNPTSTKKMVKHDDPMIRDKKELPFSNIVVAFVVFIPFLLIITPLWLVVLLPLTVVWQIIDYVKSSIVGRKKPKSSFVVEDPKAVADKVVKVSTAVKDRVYDLVVFGATGFTGKLAAAYLAKQYGTTVRWAIAGRRREALEKVRNDLVKYNAALKDLPIVIADSFDEASLNKLAASTKVVITTAGPFSIYGAPLVKSCACKEFCSILICFPSNTHKQCMELTTVISLERLIGSEK